MSFKNCAQYIQIFYEGLRDKNYKIMKNYENYKNYKN